MSVTTAVQPRVVDVNVAGRLTPRLAERVLDVVRKIIVDGPRSVIVDLSDVTGVSAAGVGALFVLADLARDWPESPVLLVAAAPLHEKLKAVKVAERFLMRSTLLAARASVGAEPPVPVDRLDLGSSANAPTMARHFVLEHLPADASTHLRDSAALVVTELVTNAVVHGGDQVQLSMVRRGRVLRIAVRDSGPPAELIFPELADTDAFHGRGLMVVRALSARFGVVQAGAGGKVVWSLLDDEPPPITTGAV